MIMSTLNWVYEPKAATPPFQRTSTRQLHGCERHARWADSSGRGVGADDMDDEECLDAWARCLDSTFLSRLYGVKRYLAFVDRAIRRVKDYFEVKAIAA